MNTKLTLSKINSALSFLKTLLYRKIADLPPLTGIIYPDTNDRDNPTEANELVIGCNTVWGGERNYFDVSACFHVSDGGTGEVALLLELGSSKSLEALSFLYGPEALVYCDSKLYAGVDPNRPVIPLDSAMTDGRQHRIRLRGWTGIKDEMYISGNLQIIEINGMLKEFVYRVEVCLDTIEHTEGSFTAHQMIAALDSAFKVIDMREPVGTAFNDSINDAGRILINELKKVGNKNNQSVVACGHGHIDLAWLWRTKLAVDKGARTFVNVLNLMDGHKDFFFSQTQAQLYQWIEEKYPEVFERIKEKVSSGSWEILGGMWVEPDCNLSGAEAMVRQFLLFSKYMKEKFGTTGSPVVWLPDTFGFSGQLPQLMAGAGIKYFSTAKLTWNQYNKMPGEYFWWEGIDGSRALSYLVSTSKPGWWGATYSADLSVQEISATWKAMNANGIHNEILIAYGHGDGGGGPTAEMLEKSAIIDGLPGASRVKKGKFIDFFRELETKGDNLPVWVGELYFELHRGTYTSQAKTKQLNRKSEVLIHNAEFLAAWAKTVSDYNYPCKELQRAWELICLNQFHDILPGSSIAEVYADNQAEYREVEQICSSIVREAVLKLGGKIDAKADYVVFNCTPFAQQSIVRLPLLPDQAGYITDGPAIVRSVQSGGHLLAEVTAIPAYGFKCLYLKKSDEALESPCNSRAWIEEKETGWVLQNESIYLQLDNQANMIRIFDKKREREVAQPDNPCNRWKLYEDRPIDWEAWDIDEYYKEKGFAEAKLLKAETIQEGGLIAGIRIEKAIGSSTIRQTIWLDAQKPVIHFDTTIDWKERRALLKVDFPVQVRNEHAVYDIQWGNVKRPTHLNTSWDAARFETYMHKWADISEGDYGVSLLNDCKYGVDIHNSCISLTALKGACFPDARADLGVHSFSYAILIHEGDHKTCTAPQAYLLNNPLIALKSDFSGGESSEAGFISGTGLIVETVKAAEEENAVVIRAYEPNNSRGLCRLEMNYAPGKANRCSILEVDGEPVRLDGNTIEVNYRPFEIITLKIKQ